MGAAAENHPEKNLCVGLVAHVDAGKTTLSEGMLYLAGNLRRLGRVDHQDVFLDHFALERQRGITIFSKQAVLTLPHGRVTLLDTPGHVDFSSEMERTLQVLDYAVLVISGTDGIQSHTRTLWQLLEAYRIPTFFFINKMDLPGPGQQALAAQLKNAFGEGCIPCWPRTPQTEEEAALLDEDALAEYLETGSLSDAAFCRMIAGRRLFPCLFGSALRLEGVGQLLELLDRWTRQPAYPAQFGARVFKITRDSQGARLSHLKITGGTLHVKDLLSGRRPDGQPWQEKVDQIRLYSGSKYQAVPQAEAGSVCAVTGLRETWAGEGLGDEARSPAPRLEPVLSYRLVLPEGTDPHQALSQLRQLEEEDPQLHLAWNSALGEIHLRLMGEIQLEILQELIAQRFGLAVQFDQGSILYQETIAAPVEGVGHFEPLRHYAEVHLLLEPLSPGSGLQFQSRCKEEELDRSWQRLILTHLREKTHLGVLTGSPVTDLRITLVSGRAHQKHTEGGDFRQATYRAVRQGLRKAQSILLEPVYRFRLEVPSSCVGRAMSDLQQLSARVDAPLTEGEQSVLTGVGPVSCLRDYQRQVASYTQGRGSFGCIPAGYEPCHNAEEVIAAVGYDCDADLENTADSVFCDHGAGHTVRWDEVEQWMHLPAWLPAGRGASDPAPAQERCKRPPQDALEEDRELMAIYERTYGQIRPRDFRPTPSAAQQLQELKWQDAGPEYLLVDGYNIIFAWEELKEIAKTDLESARAALIDLMANYQNFKQCVQILVFDAYKVPGGRERVYQHRGIYVVFTKEAETADNYIEKTTFQIGEKHRVRVATSDYLEQIITLGHGALRVSARTFHEEVAHTSGEIRRIIEENNWKNRHFGQIGSIPPVK